MYPKLVALDTDWTIFWGWLDSNTWGGGQYGPVEDSIESINYWEIQDRYNRNNKCGMYGAIPAIIEDIMKNGAQLAIVSQNTSKAMCDRALYFFKVKDAFGNEKSLIELVTFDEVYPGSKIGHFRNINQCSGINYSDMILFDDEATNNDVEMMIGVTFQVSRDGQGLTWEGYQEGLAMWRRNKDLYSPWYGLDLNAYPNKKLIGYSGMDLETITLLEQGWRRHDRKEAARFGFAMYVADDPAVAKYFCDWINKTAFNSQATTIVCAIYAREGVKWDRLPKIWVPDEENLKTDVNDEPFKLSWSIEDRDRHIARWGIQKPYVLFARHPNMNLFYVNPDPVFPVPNHQRFTEMVIYPQIQEALILTIRLPDYEVNRLIDTNYHLHYESKVQEWNIMMPYETAQDFARYGETSFY